MDLFLRVLGGIIWNIKFNKKDFVMKIYFQNVACNIISRMPGDINTLLGQLLEAWKQWPITSKTELCVRNILANEKDQTLQS